MTSLDDTKAERFKTEVGLTEKILEVELYKRFYEEEIIQTGKLRKQVAELRKQVEELETERKGLMDIVDRIHSHA